MPSFSKHSLERLSTCHFNLQRVASAAIKRTDFVVLCGHRNKEQQTEAFEDGHSKLPWDESRHNSLPAEAFDLAPYPIDWADTERFRALAVIILEEADKLGINIEWGGHWKLIDMPHFELVKES